MFCTKCGKSMQPGDEFCARCGTPARAEERGSAQVQQAPTQPMPAAVPPPKREKKGAAAFFSSPVGIVVIALVALCVIAAVVVPVVLVTRDSDAGFKKSLAATWEDFQDCTAKMDSQLGSVTDLNTMNVSSLRSFISENKDSIGNVKNELANLTPPDKYKSNYEHLLQAVKDFENYLSKLESFITAHAADPSNPQLDGLLTDMTNLASAVKTHVKGFFQSNDAVAAAVFEPAILGLPPEYAAQLATFRQVKAQEEAATKAAEEKKAAEQKKAAEEKKTVVSEEQACKNAMLSYVNSIGGPYERTWVETFLWGNPEHTVATGTVGIVAADASTSFIPVSATKSGGVWVGGE